MWSHRKTFYRDNVKCVFWCLVLDASRRSKSTAIMMSHRYDFKGKLGIKKAFVLTFFLPWKRCLWDTLRRRLGKVTFMSSIYASFFGQLTTSLYYDEPNQMLKNVTTKRDLDARRIQKDYKSEFYLRAVWLPGEIKNQKHPITYSQWYWGDIEVIVSDFFLFFQTFQSSSSHLFGILLDLSMSLKRKPCVCFMNVQ